MIPSLGRTVHYVLPKGARHQGQHRSARISQVWTDKPGAAATEETPVALAVDLDPLNDNDLFLNGLPLRFVKNSTQDPLGKLEGSWHEPERAVIPAPEKKAFAKPELKPELQPA